MKIIYTFSSEDYRVGRVGFTSETHAKQAARGHGEFGSDAIVFPLRVFDTPEEFAIQQNKNLVQSAFNKLTPDERRAVGLI